MSLMKSTNPVLGDGILDKDFIITDEGTMTINGAVNKTFIFVIILMAAATFGYNLAMSNSLSTPMLFGGLFLGIGLAFGAYFKPQYAMYFGGGYCLVKGVVIGAISAMYSIMFPGIIVQALVLTGAVLFSMLFLYKARIIKVTEKFRSIITIATVGIGVFYLVALGVGMFGIQIPLLHSNGLMGIGFSVFVTVLAAMNLLLDFDFIEKVAEIGLPKHMEWYGAFGLIVTLVWLYLEILRLLSQ